VTSHENLLWEKGAKETEKIDSVKVVIIMRVSRQVSGEEGF